MSSDKEITRLVFAVRKLASADTADANLEKYVDSIHSFVAGIGHGPKIPVVASAEDDAKLDSIKDSLAKMHAVATTTSANYKRILSICAGLKSAVEIAERPNYASFRPKISSIVKKVAGIFAEVDTVEDLDKPLAEIEKAVHALYGPSQSSNSAYYFDRRGKGHHSE
jgi:hypothetical protein